MGDLLIFAVIICLVAIIICAAFSAIIAKLLIWRLPNIDPQKVARLAATMLPSLIAIVTVFAFVLDSFNPDPITGPQAQGGLIIALVVFGLVLVGVPVGYASARKVVELSEGK